MNLAGSPLAQRLGMAAAVALATSVAAWEGRRLIAYTDLAGVPTACDGITGPDVIPGKTYTNAECDALLAKNLDRHAAAAFACITVPLADHERVAWAHFAYNVGAVAFCGSTAARKLNAGDYAGACAEISRWTYVAGKDCRLPASGCAGIPARRDHERAMCEGRVPIPGVFDNVIAGSASTAPGKP